MSKRSSRLGFTKFRKLFAKRPYFFDEPVEALYLFYRFGYMKGFLDAKKDNSNDE